MDILECEPSLIIVGGEFSDDIDLDWIPLEIDEDNSNMVEWEGDHGSLVSVYEDMILSRGDTMDEAAEGYKRIQNALVWTAPSDIEVPDYSVLNTNFELFVSGTDSEVDDMMDHLHDLEGVTGVRSFDSDDVSDPPSGATHLILFMGFDKDIDEVDGSYVGYVKDYVESI